ncbi:MAG: putative toxin-antitoxin system toxin component, PIN family [Armatimonadetes bacterium CG_4_10_14_3_um_filter_59_10]|nr:MAG: putative toxin-antitoxin system toxin component, PIN family [Armatimonadetes bacterium CG_4_8_14_3_um_filter_58_9]PIY38259.1 MAG: putative toxin-antitoxin system toxin component, PIN family [Armatimonadetes bacterium CG_4_10_14_3_um_filter_59_10]
MISALINRKGMPARILRHLARNRFWLVTSQPLLDEFIEVTHRSSL